MRGSCKNLFQSYINCMSVFLCRGKKKARESSVRIGFQENILMSSKSKRFNFLVEEHILRYQC